MYKENLILLVENLWISTQRTRVQSKVQDSQWVKEAEEEFTTVEWLKSEEGTGEKDAFRLQTAEMLGDSQESLARKIRNVYTYSIYRIYMYQPNAN